MKEKSSSAISIIGGADGPTSVWIAGRTKQKNVFRRWKRYIWQWQQKRKRDRVLTDLKKNIAVIDKQAHSLEEVPVTSKWSWNFYTGYFNAAVLPRRANRSRQKR